MIRNWKFFSNYWLTNAHYALLKYEDHRFAN